MNKSRFLRIAAGLLAVLILAGCDFLKNPDYVDSLNLPRELPYARIVSSSDTTTPGYNAHTFVLEWKRKSGLLPYVSKDPEDDVRGILDDVLEKWGEYASLIDPVPFYDKDGDGKATAEDGTMGFGVYDVLIPQGSELCLDNTDPDDNGNIVIHRYWPKLEDVSEVTPEAITVEVWYAAEGMRKKAFKNAVTEIEGMIASIKASPLYTTQELPNPLHYLVEAMEEVISYNPPLAECEQRDRFDTTRNGTRGSVVINTDLVMTGPLYEYYLGYVPYREDYVVETGPFSFPDTPVKPNIGP
ncbi:hypothetical protein AGMMS49940_20030 [Spirochaetia bacterium]|nr:hypothetical protein AGMMS49940_20030 [Spirochaetia bacterium]